jgi:hypothetical protein
MSLLLPPRFVPVFALVSLAAVFTGCTTTTTVLVPVLGDTEKIRVDIGSSGPAKVSGDGFEVTFAGFIPHPAPQRPDFAFGFTVKNAQAPRRVIIEDITEEKSTLLLTDDAPTLSGNQWRRDVTGMLATDPRLEWLTKLNNEMRIYRFTITAADGHKVVLNQATSYPGFAKTQILESLTPKP